MPGGARGQRDKKFDLLPPLVPCPALEWVVSVPAFNANDELDKRIFPMPKSLFFHARVSVCAHLSL